MAATLNTIELTGVTPDATQIADGGNLNFQMVDASASDATKQFLRPLAGTYYSYWKSVYLNALTTPPTQINNVKLYSDGAIAWVGVELFVGDEMPTVGNYEQATGTEGSSGDELVANHGGISAKTTMNTYTSGSPKSITGSISNPSVGAITRLMLLQMNITTVANTGDAGSAPLTFTYDET